MTAQVSHKQRKIKCIWMCKSSVKNSTQSRIVSRSYEYDAFGVQLTDTDETDTNPYRYSGEYYDAESGYTYLRARYYNPSIGRFINEDPALDGTNWYIYCGNDPIGMIDPSGLWSKKVHKEMTIKAYNKILDGKLKDVLMSKILLIYGSYHPDMARKIEGDDCPLAKARWHGKGDNYSTQKNRQLNRAKRLWDEGNYKEACFELGKGIHTVQDRQAHTVLLNGIRENTKKVADGYYITSNSVYVTLPNGQKICVAASSPIDENMKIYFSNDFFEKCKANGVNGKALASYSGKTLHKITADNVNADFENNIWVYKKHKSNRYKRAVNNTKKYMTKFLKKIKS